MQLLHNEQEISRFAGCITLTTHRVRYDSKVTGRHDVVSIMMNEVASCAMAHTSSPMLLVVAGILLTAGIVTSQKVGVAFPWMIGLALAVFFTLGYFVSRRQTLVIASAGAKIEITLGGTNAVEVLRFMDQVEEAKNGYYLIP